MIGGNIKNKIIAAASAAAILVGSAFSASFLTINKRAENQKSYQYVLRDIESFDVDTSVIDSFGHGNYDKCVRLKFDEDRPVIVDCEGQMPEKEMRIIQKVVDYYNLIFSTINENYKFVIRDKNTDVKLTDTIISIFNEDLNGSAGQNRSKNKIPDLGEGHFISRNDIAIDWDSIEDEDELYIYAVVLHEFGHALGFGDVYYEGKTKNVDCIDMTTMMQHQNTITSALYPNDYAILQALYSNEYKKHSNYEDAVKVVNEKIARYTKGFYKYYAGVMRERYRATDLLKEEELGSEIIWHGEYESNCDYTYTLKLNGDSTCNLIIKDKNGRILQQGSGETIFVDGMLFVKRVVFDNAFNYTKKYSEGLDMKLMLCLYKLNDGVLRIGDGTNVSFGHTSLSYEHAHMK